MTAEKLCNLLKGCDPYAEVTYTLGNIDYSDAVCKAALASNYDDFEGNPMARLKPFAVRIDMEDGDVQIELVDDNGCNLDVLEAAYNQRHLYVSTDEPLEDLIEQLKEMYKELEDIAATD